jgi:hypothetical protein
LNQNDRAERRKKMQKINCWPKENCSTNFLVKKNRKKN